MDEKIASSGKAIFMLQTDDEALAFWNEPAKAKIVTMYMPGCGWCDKFIPEYVQLAPTVANSDLLFGSASRDQIDKVSKFIPALSVQGFPTTILVDSTNKVRQVVPGFKSAVQMVDVILNTFPELKGLNSIEYLETIRRERDVQRANLENRAKLPSRAGGTATNAATDSANALKPASELVSTAGSGTIGDHALPPHLRTAAAAAPPPTPTPTPLAVGAGTTKTAGAGAGAGAGAAGGAATEGAPKAVTNGLKRHRSRHHHHRRAPKVAGTGGVADANSAAAEAKENGWCAIL